MKTIAIRLEDEISAQLAVLAQLEGSSVTELIRQGAELIIQQKRSQAELADKAAGIVAEIDQEAEARKSAIQALFGATTAPASPPAKGRGPRQEGRGAG
jgi:predicted CopG family antitoxin